MRQERIHRPHGESPMAKPSAKSPSKPPDVIFKAKNAAQKKMQQIWPSARIIFAIGKAGTGKTHCALALALLEKKFPLWLCRPAVGCGEELGFTPGTIDEKLMGAAVNKSRNIHAALDRKLDLM